MNNACTAKSPPPVHVIGLGPGLAPIRELLALPEVREAQVLVAGKALLALLAAHPARKIPVTADIDGLAESLRRGRASGLRQTVLCSGDPLFFGLGGSLSKALGPSALAVHPGISCLQAAASLLSLPWEGVRAVSLHGRADYLPLAHALTSGAPVLVLTDAVNGPARIAAWMRERGLACRALHILEDLALEPGGTVSVGRRLCLTPDQILGGEAENPDGEAQALKGESRSPNGKPQGLKGGGEAPHVPPGGPAARRVLFLEPLPERERPLFGFADHAFAREKNLLTKGPVRAAALAALGVAPGHVIWDLGAGCGALAVEAARLACRGAVYAVERDPVRRELIAVNRQRFGAANLEILAGEMPGCLPVLGKGMPGGAGRDRLGEEKAEASQGPCLDLPAPDAVFLGGGLGGANNNGAETLRRAWAALKPGGRLVAACVLLGSLELARSELTRLGARLGLDCIQAGCGSPLAGDLRLEALNPVFLVRGEKAPFSGVDE